MINNAKRLKENILINFNADKEMLKYWEEDDGLIFQSNILTIPTSKLKEYVDINALTKEFSNKVNSISVSNNDISMTFSNGDSNKVLSLKGIYDEIEDTTNYVNRVLNKFNIEDYKLICNFYPNAYSMDEYSKIEREKLKLESKLLKIQSDVIECLYKEEIAI